MSNKVKKIRDLAEITRHAKDAGELVVLCHGVFDLLHIGHIKHFQEAKTLGHLLIVTITPDRFVNKGPHRPAFTAELRLQALAALDCIDFVAVNEWPAATKALELIKPNFYCKGPDYKKHADDVTGEIDNEEKAIQAVGGQLYYTSDITFSSSSLLNTYFNPLDDEQKQFLDKLSSKYSFSVIKQYLDKLQFAKVGVIGETIIDEYVFCEALGKSGKEPVLAVRELFSQRYLGGALAIARHAIQFSEDVSIVSFIGEEREEEAFIEANMEPAITLKFLAKNGSPTIIKKRIVENVNKQKMLGIYSLNDQSLNQEDEELLSEALAIELAQRDVVIVADYGHGMMTPTIAKQISDAKTFVSLNAQVNASNLGKHSIGKYRSVDCLIINATELEFEMREHEGDLVNLAFTLKSTIGASYICVTKGKNGAFLIGPEGDVSECPAFASKVHDKVGAGDALLSILSSCLYSSLPADISLFTASLAAAQSAETMGNSVPVSKSMILKTIDHLLK